MNNDLQILPATAAIGLIALAIGVWVGYKDESKQSEGEKGIGPASLGCAISLGVPIVGLTGSWLTNHGVEGTIGAVAYATGTAFGRRMSKKRSER